MNNKGHACRQAGQTLLEVLGALGAATIVLIAVTAITGTSLSNAQFSKNQNQATFYAQQGIEIIRNLRDSEEWSVFSARSGGTYCIDENGALVEGSACAENIRGIFSRKASFTTTPSGGVQVDLTVSFVDSKGVHTSRLITVLTNWQ